MVPPVCRLRQDRNRRDAVVMAAPSAEFPCAASPEEPQAPDAFSAPSPPAGPSGQDPIHAAPDGSAHPQPCAGFQVTEGQPLDPQAGSTTADQLVRSLAEASRRFDGTSADPERNCWLAVHQHVHGVLPSEYDIREVPEDLYLAVLAQRRRQDRERSA